MDLFFEQLEKVFIEGNEKYARNVIPEDPLFVPGYYYPPSYNMFCALGKEGMTCDEEEIINHLYSKEEIKARMKSDIE